MPQPRPSSASSGAVDGRGGSRWSTHASPPRGVDDATHETYQQRAARIADWRRRLLAAVRLQERLQLLHQLGLTDAEVARAIPDGKARSVRRWRLEGVARARVASRWEPIDDLCAIIGYLLSDGTYDEASVLAWLRSRHPDLTRDRPLDVLGTGNFGAVFQAAENTLAPPAAESPTTQGPLSRPIDPDKRRT